MDPQSDTDIPTRWPAQPETAAPPALREGSPEPEALAANLQTDNLRVLIVEDSSIVRGRLARLIAGVPGVSVIDMAGDGTHALALIRECKPDAIILDIELPGLDGIELLTRLRAEQFTGNVVILTTYAFDELRRKCLDLGAEYFFDKAMEFTRVAEVVGNLARKKLAQDSREQR